MKRYMMLLMPAFVTSIAACGGSEPGEVENMASVGTVTVSAVASTTAGSQVPARVVALETANLATRGSGTVEAVLVDVGSSVRRGQVLVRLEGAGVEAAVATAEARATVARRTYQRLANLERDGAATRHELDQAEAALRTAEAMLEEASASRDYIVLRAPFDGTVTARFADPGDLAVPGRPVLVVSGSARLKIVADVPALLSGAVAEGGSLVAVSPETGDRWAATARQVVSVIDPTSQRFRVEATFDGADDLPVAGTLLRLEIPGPGTSSVWVPADAVVRRGQLSGVYLAGDGELRLRWIRPGRRTATAVEVLAGVDQGALVVRNPNPGLVDGTRTAGTEVAAWTFSPEGER